MGSSELASIFGLLAQLAELLGAGAGSSVSVPGN